MSETAYRRCPAGCMDGDIPVYGLNGVQTGQEVCQTCCGTGYVEVPGAVILDAATAATAKEACVSQALAMSRIADDAFAAGEHETADIYEAKTERFRLAAAALRGEGRS